MDKLLYCIEVRDYENPDGKEFRINFNDKSEFLMVMFNLMEKGEVVTVFREVE